MITRWNDLVGHQLTRIHFHSAGTVLVLGDETEFAVVIATTYYDGEATADLAPDHSEDALEAAVAAGAPGAGDLLQDAKDLRLQTHKTQELNRLAYLKKKYPEGDQS